MNIIVRLLFIFEICATAGWCLEVVYRSLKEKRFVNPGFLNGCYLPIYGIGGTILFFACEYLLSFSTIYENLICIFLISCLGMTFIELVGGLIIIKQFNLRLWDYSDNKWNYKNCLKFKTETYTQTYKSRNIFFI